MKKFLLSILCLFVMTPVFAIEKFGDNVIKANLVTNKIASDVIVYNLSNAKLHSHDCEWAEKCTKNCIYKDKNDIDKIFYIPCAICYERLMYSTEK